MTTEQVKRRFGFASKRPDKMHFSPTSNFAKRFSHGRYCDFCGCRRCSKSPAADTSRQGYSIRCVGGYRICLTCLGRRCSSCDPAKVRDEKRGLALRTSFESRLLQQCPHRPRILPGEVRRLERELERSNYYSDVRIQRRQSARRKSAGHVSMIDRDGTFVDSFFAVDRELAAAPAEKPEEGSLESIFLWLSNFLGDS